MILLDGCQLLWVLSSYSSLASVEAAERLLFQLLHNLHHSFEQFGLTSLVSTGCQDFLDQHCYMLEHNVETNGSSFAKVIFEEVVVEYEEVLFCVVFVVDLFGSFAWTGAFASEASAFQLWLSA